MCLFVVWSPDEDLKGFFLITALLMFQNKDFFEIPLVVWAGFFLSSCSECLDCLWFLIIYH